MEILVCGATGFVGGVIARGLLDAGHNVRALTRSPQTMGKRPASDRAIAEALEAGRLTPVGGDVTDPATLPRAVRGVEVVVLAVQFKGAPIERPAEHLTYEDVDHQGTVNLLEAIKASGGTPRFLYMSGITVSADATGPGDAAKWKAERAIRQSGLPWTIVRSSWAYGPGDKALNRILGYSDFLPFVPVFGDGRQIHTPVFVEDIGRLFAALVDGPERSRHTLFGLGGPDEVTLDEFLRAALRHMGRRRPILHIPVPLARLQAELLQLLPWRPLTPDAVDFVAREGAATAADRRLLAQRFPGFATTPLEEGLASYMGR